MVWSAMTMRGASAAALLVLVALVAGARAEDPYHFFEWKVTYGTKNILGTPQKVILINGQFPGPTINCTSNNNILVNVFNMLDQPLLFHWYVIDLVPTSLHGRRQTAT
jgi:L-ascorbate oxidase